MSLLMDALRKAEEEKKRAAQEQQLSSTQEGAAAADAGSTTGETAESEVGGSTDSLIDTSRLSLEPIESTQQSPTEPPADFDAGTEISLETPDEKTTRFELAGEVPEFAEAEAGPDETTMRRPGLPEPAEAGMEATPEDMEATKPSQKAVQSSVQEYFEASQSMSLEMQRAQARAAAGDFTGATPVSAHTVFSAKSRRSTSRLLVYVTLVGLVLAGGLGAVGLWYYTGTPAIQAPLSPLLAHNVEKPVAPPLKLPAVQPQARSEQASVPTTGEVAPAASEAPAAPPVQPPEKTAGNAATSPETAVAVAPAHALAQPASEAAPKAEAVPPTVPPAKPVAAPAAIAAAAPTSTPTQKPPTLSWSPPPAAPASDVMPGQLQIRRLPARLRVNRNVKEAYAAYQRGDMNRAETLYREALAREPDQRDALLGIAAIASRRGDRDEAMNYYNRVLALDPHDAYANAAMVALAQDSDPVGDESRLKLMLQSAPDSAYINFMLGNTYARQSRWAAAQQAYFNAYSYESGNADYAYNLAVSLDHLGQRQAAADYYRKALALAGNGATGFTAAQVQTRIQALAGGDTGTSP